MYFPLSICSYRVLAYTYCSFTPESNPLTLAKLIKGNNLTKKIFIEYKFSQQNTMQNFRITLRYKIRLRA